MSNHTEQLLKKLNQYIKNINVQLTQLEAEQHANNKIQQRFDQQLFKPIVKHVDEYLQEVTKNYQQLEQLVKSQKVDQINYLAQKITDQITALQRELATQRLRRSEQLYRTESTSSQQYQTLAQYQDYQRRLENMIEDRHLLLNQIIPGQIQEKQKLEHEIVQLTHRYERCCQALKSLESQIEMDEKKC